MPILVCSRLLAGKLHNQYSWESINFSINMVKICSIHSFLLGAPYGIMVAYVMIGIVISKAQVALWDNKDIILTLLTVICYASFKKNTLEKVI